MSQIGYAARYVRIDTKNYYLPQTRVRGYMFCMDNTLLKRLEFVVTWFAWISCFTSQKDKIFQNT